MWFAVLGACLVRLIATNSGLLWKICKRFGLSPISCSQTSPSRCRPEVAPILSRLGISTRTPSSDRACVESLRCRRALCELDDEERAGVRRERRFFGLAVYVANRREWPRSSSRPNLETPWRGLRLTAATRALIVASPEAPCPRRSQTLDMSTAERWGQCVVGRPDYAGECGRFGPRQSIGVVNAL